MRTIEAPQGKRLTRLLQKPLLVHKPPDSIWLALHLPPEIETYSALHGYLWAKYHIRVVSAETDMADMGDLFYENTYNGWMGAIDSLIPGRLVFMICPKHYVGWTSDEHGIDHAKPYTAQWAKLITDAEILGASAHGPKVVITK